MTDQPEHNVEHLAALARAAGVDLSADPALVASHRQATTTELAALRNLVRALIRELHGAADALEPVEVVDVQRVVAGMRSAASGAETQLTHGTVAAVRA